MPFVLLSKFCVPNATVLAVESLTCAPQTNNVFSRLSHRHSSKADEGKVALVLSRTRKMKRVDENALALPDSNVLSLRKQVGETKYQLRGLSAASLVGCLEESWSSFLSRARGEQSKQDFESRAELEAGPRPLSTQRNEGGETGLEIFYCGLLVLLEARLSGLGISASDLAKGSELFKRAYQTDYPSRVFRTFSDLTRINNGSCANLIMESQHPLTLQRPELLSRAMLLLDDNLSFIVSDLKSALLRSRGRLSTYKTKPKRGTLLGFHGAQHLKAVVKAQPDILDYAEALMVVDENNSRLTEVVEWVLRQNGGSTLRKPLFVLKDLSSFTFAKEDYDVVVLSLFSIPINRDRQILRSLEKACHELIMVDICQSPVDRDVKYLATPWRVCRVVDIMETSLKMAEKLSMTANEEELIRVEEDRRNIVPWFLHKFGVLNSEQAEQSAQDWIQSMISSGFSESSIRIIVERKPPVSLFVIRATSFEPADDLELDDVEQVSEV